MGNFFEDFAQKHEDLKKRIHSFRLPIKSRAGLMFMRLFYFSIPLTIGVVSLHKVNQIREENAAAHKDRLEELRRARERTDGQTLR